MTLGRSGLQVSRIADCVHTIVALLARRGPITRRGLQVALGVLWLLDGALQSQPFMFTRGFALQLPITRS